MAISSHVLVGDCRAWSRLLARWGPFVDAVITDPPYLINFMGKAWDRGGVSFDPRTWRSIALAAKPGAHLLAFGGTRTAHRIACAIEDAGWEIRDSLAWMFGSGYPKGTPLAKDERFCQCGVPARSADRTSGVQPHAFHKSKVVVVFGDAPPPSDGARSTCTGTGSMVGCLTGRDSHGAQPRQRGDNALASTPSPQCVPAHNRSFWRGDDPASAPTGNLSRARCTSHPSSTDLLRLSAHEAAGERKHGSMSRADTSESYSRKRDRGHLSYTEYSTGFPVCNSCGRPVVVGWNTALKPAHEPVYLARKPLAGTVAANVLRYGTGALDVDGCRIPTSTADAAAMERCNTPGSGRWRDRRSMGIAALHTGEKTETARPLDTTAGRWPPNVLLTHDAACTEAHCEPDCPVRMLDEQSGERPSAGNKNPTHGGHIFDGGKGIPQSVAEVSKGDEGGASRYFPRFRYTPKADRSERERGCEMLPPGKGGIRNTHPTVKPVELMRWLVRLSCPPGGLVFDPFAGSGTTGIACALEGRHFLGIELDPESVDIARARIAHVTGQPFEPASNREMAEPKQRSLF